MKFYTLIFLCFLLCISIAAPVSVSAAIVFVDKNATGSETGTTCSTHINIFKTALMMRNPGMKSGSQKADMYLAQNMAVAALNTPLFK